MNFGKFQFELNDIHANRLFVLRFSSLSCCVLASCVRLSSLGDTYVC